MGQPDFYPFVISNPVVAKLQFVQMVVADAATAPVVWAAAAGALVPEPADWSTMVLRLLALGLPPAANGAGR